MEVERATRWDSPGHGSGDVEALGVHTQGSEAHTDTAIQEHMEIQDRVNKPGLSHAGLPRCRARRSTTAWSEKTKCS